MIDRYAAKRFKAAATSIKPAQVLFVSPTSFAEMKNLFAPTRLVVRQVTLVALLVFFAALTSSPSILRGFTPDAISKAVPILLIGVLAVKGNYRLPTKLLLPWGICFSVMLISGVQINWLVTNSAPAINGAIIVVLVLALATQLKNEAFAHLVVKWWVVLFWIISICSIANWVLAQTVPSFFKDIDFGQFYEGNARSYLISPFGAVVLQDYGIFALYRVTGILAEPGMMSMFFLVNAAMSLFEKSPLFSRRFGLANLLAAFATHSVAFYFALSVLLVFYLVKGKNRKLQVLVACVVCVAFVINYGFVEEIVQGLLERSSFDVRESDSDFLSQKIAADPLASLIGYAWWGDYRQLPAAFPQLLYQAGLIGVISYAAILWFFLRGSLPVAIVVYIYGLSIDYQTFMIFSLLLFVVRAHSEIEGKQQSVHTRRVPFYAMEAGSVPNETASEQRPRHQRGVII